MENQRKKYDERKGKGKSYVLWKVMGSPFFVVFFFLLFLI